jgi:hypothetical protein
VNSELIEKEKEAIKYLRIFEHRPLKYTRCDVLFQQPSNPRWLKNDSGEG